jgi:hypothetical protein
MKKILLTLLLLSGCGGGGNGAEDQQTVVTPTPTNPDAGTILETSCDGTTLIETIADGNGGSTEETTENSPDCGYEEPQFTPAGTPIGDSYCGRSAPAERFQQLLEILNHVRHDDRFQDYADGEGGEYTNRIVHLDQSCFVQTLTDPDDCPTTETDTGHPEFGYITCDGVRQKSPVSFPYNVDDPVPGWAVIDILVVLDTKLTEEDLDGMTREEFVYHQFFVANHMYDVSNTSIRLRVAGIVDVDVAAGDLYRQYAAFFNGRYEFNGLDDWQREAEADLAFLFKKRPEEPIACGVASLDATHGLDKTRGITQCFHNSVFQENATTRYYERAHETFAHEVGHLLGAQHEWNDADTPGLFEFSYGYHLEGYEPRKDDPEYVGVYSGYGTIMSYADLATGKFSDRDSTCTYPEEAGEYAGQSVNFGTNGGCFCLDPIEDQPPPTDNTDTLRRTRYIMSQLHEMSHDVQSSPSWYNMKMDGLTVEVDPQICLF